MSSVNFDLFSVSFSFRPLVFPKGKQSIQLFSFSFLQNSRKLRDAKFLTSRVIHRCGVTADSWPQLRTRQKVYKLISCILILFRLIDSFGSTKQFFLTNFTVIRFAENTLFHYKNESTQRFPTFQKN